MESRTQLYFARTHSAGRSNSVNMSRMYPVAYGADYIDARVKCIDFLRHLHLRYPDKSPLGLVKRAMGRLQLEVGT